MSILFFSTAVFACNTIHEAAQSCVNPRLPLRFSALLEDEYLTLQQLRKTAGLTQISVSECLNMPQPNVSRLEKGSDILLSTLRNYVKSVGGKLYLTVELPDKPPIALTGLGDLI